MPAMLAAAREVVAGAVNDVVGADRPGQVRLRRAAHAGDLRPEHPGLLHRERSHAARRAGDQNLLPGPYPSPVAKTRQTVHAEMGTAATCPR